MAVLIDLESLVEWSSAHQEIDILERDDEGRPSKSRQVVKIVGVSDEQLLDYTFYPDGVSWTLVRSKQQRAQEGRYTLTPDGDSTVVRLDLTVDLFAPLPGFLDQEGRVGLDGHRDRRPAQARARGHARLTASRRPATRPAAGSSTPG